MGSRSIIIDWCMSNLVSVTEQEDNSFIKSKL